MSAPDPQETVLEQCGYHRTGPKVGRNVVAWRARCRRMVRVPKGSVFVRCWQHPISWRSR